MELFKNTRQKIGKSLLAKKAAGTKRKVFFSNMFQVKEIGIVWDVSRPDEFVLLSKFHQKMSERNIDVRILGYFPGKNLPDKLTAIRYLTCIKRNELDFFYQPFSSEARSFIDNQFDILIDINFNNLFPLHYISSLSNAKFKVGLLVSETREAPFDLMMEIKAPVDVDDYLKQTVQYLEMIKAEEV
jgi:hypothetical protein